MLPINRFNHWLSKLEELLHSAPDANTVAEHLYANNARTYAFMLEGLAKLYSNLHNEKKFKKMLKDCKALEDLFGQVDYYDGFLKIHASNPNFPAEIIEHWKTARKSVMEDANQLLVKRDWLKSGKKNRISKMRKKLDTADWMKPKKEVAKIFEYYVDEIKQLKNFVNKAGLPFTQIEEQVHEVRRRLRWLSIYPQALLGAIQFSNVEPKTNLNKYLVPAVLASPYNQFPPPGDNECVLLLDKRNFFALSFVIAALGEMKDHGLEFHAVEAALKQIQGVDDATAINKASEILQRDNSPIEKILADASSLIQQFLEDKCLDNLVLDVACNGK